MEERAEDDRRTGHGRGQDLELVEEVEEEEEVVEERENGEREGDGGGMGGEGEQGSEAGSSAKDRGRRATPIMRALSQAQRTHHDRTTPTTGALLVSPTRLKAPVPLSPSPLRKPRSPHRPPAPLPPKVDEARLACSPPTAGMRTLDPLPLRDDVWVDSGIMAKEPQRKRSPARRSSRRRASSAQDWDSPCATANRIHGSLRNPEFQHNGNLGLLRPWLFVYPTSETAVSDEGEEERMSQISARSAESCSMATHVLGRAIKRKDDFWGKS
ncbi:nuclear protein MDM1 [Engraulis encrasicolus]|uniref:nuclear protein MDM1 n=1 Tax=Engraulis encrasicolus TaxID=184585 RepID=UPI002FD54A71